MGNAVIVEEGKAPVVLNDSDVATSDVLDALMYQHGNNQLVSSMARWVLQSQAEWDTPTGGPRAGGLFERDRYVTPGKIFDQMRTARDAVDSDDVISGVADTTESLAFSSMSFYAENEDEENVWNQWAADIDLDSRLREMWRELFTYSQFTVAVWWGRRTYKVKGKTEKGNEKRKTFSNLEVPIGLTILDPIKVLPIGQTMFNQEQLCYLADPEEAEQFDKAVGDRRGVDPIVEKLIIAKYEPSREELTRLQREEGFDLGRGSLYLLNPGNVWRHTLTRPQYRRFAALRLKSCFELLDLKHQLRQMDRAHLIGGTNFIVLIKKGTDEHPAQPSEIAHLQASVKVVARVPVIVGDHRLSVEIVTPKTDNTLRPERYNTIDSRLTARCFQMFLLGNYHAGSGGDDSMKLARMVAAGMESRRHMLRRTLESNMFRPMMMRNEQLDEMAKLRFHPKKIGLDFDANFASFLMDLRAQGDLSRDSMLSQFDFDQDDEARKREREKDKFDDIFETQVPGAPAQPGAPAPATAPAKKAAGRAGGGRKNGGGAAPGSGQGQAPRNVRKRSDGSQPKPKTPTKAAEEAPDEEETDE